MQIRNLPSLTRLGVDYNEDFLIMGEDKVGPIFWSPVVIRGRNGGSYLNGTPHGRTVWDAVSGLCFDKDPISSNPLSIDQLTGIYEIKGDHEPSEPTKLIMGSASQGGLMLGLEKGGGDIVKKLKLLIQTTGEKTAGILIVSDRQFQQFLELALAIQSFALSQKVK